MNWNRCKRGIVERVCERGRVRVCVEDGIARQKETFWGGKYGYKIGVT